MLTRIVGLTLAATIFCADENRIKLRLAGQHGETMQEGQTVRGYQVETWANETTGTWTAIVLADGMACVLAAGRGWDGKPINSSLFPAA